MTIAPERVRELIRLVSAGMPPKNAASAVSIAYPTALRHLRISGRADLIGATRSEAHSVHIPPEQVRWAVGAYQAGLSTRKVGERLCLSKDFVRKLLANEGVTIRSPNRPTPNLDEALRELDTRLENIVLPPGIGTDGLFTPAEVAHMFRVSPKTIAAWVRRQLLPCVETPGGSRRFRKADVLRLMDPDARCDDAADVHPTG